MRPRHVGMTVSSMIFGAAIRSLSSRPYVSLIALTVGLAASAPCFSQTISLGQAGQYSIVEASMPGVNPGTLSILNSSTDGSVALGTGTAANFSVLSSAIGGALYVADSHVPANAIVDTTIAGGVNFGTNLSQAASDAANASTFAAGLADNFGSFSDSPITGVSVTGTSPPLNVVNFTNGLSLENTQTLTINGTSSQQFVFNFSDDFSLLNTNVVLNGVSARNVFFNILGGNVALSGVTFDGNILDEAGGTAAAQSKLITAKFTEASSRMGTSRFGTARSLQNSPRS